MIAFLCDICEGRWKPDDESHGWFTIATDSMGVRIGPWPKGSRLQEPHSALAHVCGNQCLWQYLVEKMKLDGVVSITPRE